MSQFVYVMEDKNTQLLKVGISIDPEFRSRQVSKLFGCEATVIGILAVDDAAKTERFIHGMFASDRVIGEWFQVNPQKREYLLAHFSDKQPATKLPRAKSPSISPAIGQVTIEDILGKRVKWPEVQEAIRLRMEKQPRGYQAALARQIGATPGFINQIIKKRVPIPIEHLDAVLDSLNMVYDVSLTVKPATPAPQAGAEATGGEG